MFQKVGAGLKTIPGKMVVIFITTGLLAAGKLLSRLERAIKGGRDLF